MKNHDHRLEVPLQESHKLTNVTLMRIPAFNGSAFQIMCGRHLMRRTIAKYDIVVRFSVGLLSTTSIASSEKRTPNLSEQTKSEATCKLQIIEARQYRPTIIPSFIISIASKQ